MYSQIEVLNARVLQLRAELREARAARKEWLPPPDRIKTLIQLCHPDKHSNSKTSTEITQWLLSLRKPK